jgi:putative salt-induced outer membrane protein YdiY
MTFDCRSLGCVLTSALAALILSVFSQAASAAEFHLKDGTVVIGTIVSLIDGEDLVVDTEYMDEVTIEWDSIVSARGTQIVEVELFNGRRELGTVSFDENGVSVVGDDTLTVDPKDVFQMSEVNETFWEALQVNTDLGMNIVRGNNQVTQVSFGGGIGYDATDFETSINATTIINEQTATEDTRRVTLNANYTHKFDGGWEAIGLYQFESDEQQNLDGRSLYGGAIGKRIINQRRHRVELYGGLAVNSEDFVDAPRSESLEGIIGARYRMRWAVDTDLSFTVLPNLEDSNRLRTQFDGSLSVDLFSDFDFKVTVYDRYDSQPPPGNEKNDTGITLGLSWEY